MGKTKSLEKVTHTGESKGPGPDHTIVMARSFSKRGGFCQRPGRLPRCSTGKRNPCSSTCPAIFCYGWARESLTSTHPQKFLANRFRTSRVPTLIDIFEKKNLFNSCHGIDLDDSWFPCRTFIHMTRPCNPLIALLHNQL